MTNTLDKVLPNKVSVADADLRLPVCVVVAATMTIEVFLQEHLKALDQRYRVTVVAKCPDPTFMLKLGLDIELIHIPIERGIAPVKDLRCLAALCDLFRMRHFCLVHSITPKAGLLTMLAGSLSLVPVRLHTFTGQVWASQNGWRRKALKAIDRCIAQFATHILADSRSQLRFLEAEGVVGEDRGTVLGNGSISGFDPRRFRPRPEKRRQLRLNFGIPESAFLFGFVGRLKRDKGVLDLARAFETLEKSGRPAYLMVVGPDEENLTQQMIELAGKNANRVFFVNWSAEPEMHMAAFDLLCLPSYREGFGSVIIEAAACGVPALASRIYGLSDAIVDGVTGMFHDCGDVDAIAVGMNRAMTEVEALRAMGSRARERALREFPATRLSEELVGHYNRLLEEVGQSGD